MTIRIRPVASSISRQLEGFTLDRVGAVENIEKIGFSSCTTTIFAANLKGAGEDAITAISQAGGISVNYPPARRDRNCR